MEVIQIYDTVNKKTLKVKVTPQIAARCKIDPAYTQALFSQIRNRNLDADSSIKITPVKNEVVVKENNERENKKECWDRKETLELITIFQRCKIYLKHPNSKKELWTVISRILSKSGIKKSPDECRQKWINLLQAYHRTLYLQGKNSFEFHKEVSNALYVQPKNKTEEMSTRTDVTEETKDKNVRYKENWTRYETLKFLKLYQQHKDQRNKFPTGKHFWNYLSDILEGDGILKSGEKLCTKWKNLYKTYRSYNLSNRLPKKFRYFEAMNCVINDLEFDDPIPYEENIKDLPDIDYASISYTFWTGEETINLIRLYKKHQHLFHTMQKKKVWETLAADMMASGFKKEAEKCETKWKNLRRSYKRNKFNKGTRFYFLKEMQSVMENEVLSEDCETDEGSIDDDNEELMDCGELEGEHCSDKESHVEEIIIKTEEQDVFWPHEEITTLIEIYGQCRQIYKYLESSDFWEKISQEMKLKNFDRSPDEYKILWEILFEQHLKSENDDTFPFHEDIKNVLSKIEQTTNNQLIRCQEFSKCLDDTDLETKNTPTISEPQDNSSREVLKHKYSCNCFEKKTETKERRHAERMKLLKRKLDIEERKVLAFEKYVQHLTKHNSHLDSDEDS